MDSSFLLLLPLLLSPGFRSSHVFASTNDCSSDTLVSAGETLTVKTEDAGHKTTTQIETLVYVKPFEGFQGVSLKVDNKHGRYHTTWIPLTFPEDQCLPQEGEWGEMKIRVQIYENIALYYMKIWLAYGGCTKVCDDNLMYYYDFLPSPQSLSVVGHGHSEWRLTEPGANCTIKKLSQHTNTFHLLCLQPPPTVTTPPGITTTPHLPTTPFSHSTTPTPTTKPPTNTPSPHPSSPSPPIPHRGAPGTPAVVVAAWLVGMVTMVTIVLVTMMVVWQVWREGSAPSHGITDRPQPGQPPHHRQVRENSLYEPFNNLDNRQ